jgi:hypothetical protein
MVRSLISSRSYWASDAKMWKISVPMAVVVSIDSCRDLNSTPLAWKSSIRVSRLESVRPMRSRR